MNLTEEKTFKQSENKDWVVVATVIKEFKNKGNKPTKKTKELVGSYETCDKAKEMADNAVEKGFYIPYFNKTNPGQSHRRIIPSKVEVVNTKTKGGQ